MRTEREKLSLFRKILHITGIVVGTLMCVVLLPLFIINVTLIIKSYTNPTEIPNMLGYTPLIVQSGSMEPAILTGDLIITKPGDTANLPAGEKDGAIIAFRTGTDTVVTHRIVERKEADGTVSYITKGDYNNTTDQNPVYESQIVGIYAARFAGLGDFAMFLQTPKGILLFVALPLALLLIYDMLRRFIADRQRKLQDKELAAELAQLRQAKEGEQEEN